MQTTFPRLLLEHAQPAARRAGAAREGIRHLADADLVRSWPRWCARWPAACAQAGLKRGAAPGGGRREPAAAVRRRCWPRSRSARSRCRCTRTRRPPSSCSRSTTPRSRFAIVEDQEQVDKLLEMRAAVPAAGAHLVRRPARPAQLQRAGPGVARRAARRRARALRRATPGFFDAEVAQRPAATTWRRCSSPRARPATRRAWCTRHLTLIDRAARRRALRQADRARRGAGLPAAGVDRPEHLLLRAVAGLRLRRQLPRVGGHGDDRPEGDRADLLLRAAARLRRPADQRDDPHGRRRRAQALAVPRASWRWRAASARR